MADRVDLVFYMRVRIDPKRHKDLIRRILDSDPLWVPTEVNLIRAIHEEIIKVDSTWPYVIEHGPLEWERPEIWLSKTLLTMGQADWGAGWAGHVDTMQQQRVARILFGGYGITATYDDVGLVGWDDGSPRPFPIQRRRRPHD